MSEEQQGGGHFESNSLSPSPVPFPSKQSPGANYTETLLLEYCFLWGNHKLTTFFLSTASRSGHPAGGDNTWVFPEPLGRGASPTMHLLKLTPSITVMNIIPPPQLHGVWGWGEIYSNAAAHQGVQTCLIGLISCQAPKIYLLL